MQEYFSLIYQGFSCASYFGDPWPTEVSSEQIPEYCPLVSQLTTRITTNPGQNRLVTLKNVCSSDIKIESSRKDRYMHTVVEMSSVLLVPTKGAILASSTQLS